MLLRALNAPLPALARISNCPWPPVVTSGANAAGAAAPELYALGGALRLACRGGGRVLLDAEAVDLVGAIKALNAALKGSGGTQAAAEKSAQDKDLRSALDLLESPELLRALLAGRGGADTSRIARGEAASTSAAASAAQASALSDVVDIYWPMIAVRAFSVATFAPFAMRCVSGLCHL